MWAVERESERLLTALQNRVARGVDEAIDGACPAGSPLRDPVARLVDVARQDNARRWHRLFPLAVLGAITGDPFPAVPVSVASTLWWAGAELFDDLVDAGTGAPMITSLPGSPGELLIAAIACGVVVPEAYLLRQPLTNDVRRRWNEEWLTGSLAAAEGQFADLARDPEALTWARVMKAYAGKTGAAYGRDAAMAAALTTPDEDMLRAWRTFGRLFGVLRQMHNDQAGDDADQDEDLANGTPTLLMGHAIETADSRRRADLLRARAAATDDRAARRRLRHLISHPESLDGYIARVSSIHEHASALLGRLTEPSPFQDALRTRLDLTAVLACHQCVSS